MKISKYLLMLLPGLLLSEQGQATLKVADALQSKMVLQQNKSFKVWGTADPGERLSIKSDWMDSPITVIAGQNGAFMGIIEVPAAKKGDFSAHRISIQAKDEQLILNDLLIGDLWLCSGQSNMQFAVKEMTGAEAVIQDADQPNIRLLSVGLNFSADPIDGFSGKWQQCSSSSVAGFSAVGYCFGRKLYEELHIPIGLIFSGIGASSVQAYLPREVLSGDALLDQTYLQPYLSDPKSKEKVDGGFSFEKVVRPFLLYNAMINPLTNLSIKGFCWYQGEANHLERESYTLATQTLVKTWRERFKQGELPFYYVQIAPYFHEKEDPKFGTDAFFREAQERVGQLNNTFMVSTMDVGDKKDLHPKNKKPVGERLAAVALNRTYGQLSVVYQGPHVQDVVFSKYGASVSFLPESLGSGLNTRDMEIPRFFYIAGADHIFYPAEAMISGNQVIIRNKKVKKPQAIRYAFFNYPVTNLQNKEGFPVLPFRTDDWPEEKW
ncbi:sialic acid-specific 9-O-acetylesterase [Pedobacter sp. BAL39]|uniref:sialate O-acetylesterase n=1 Tax=Pedobacter sp. BAL39 TaxID=391596 RepID=UPI00015599FF|nr:sialate O-acetylesterase [Pedobacter sp. BAL39]EDM36971.1 sialic acid-specific 9-O-acetylesterase [Pedobacter sp. BAL39]